MKYTIENGFLVSAKVDEVKFGEKKFKVGNLIVREAFYDELKCMACENTFYLRCPAEKIEVVKSLVDSKVYVEGNLDVTVVNKDGKSSRYYKFNCETIEKID